MQSFIAIAALFGAANAWGNYSSSAGSSAPAGSGTGSVSYTTETVSSYTTYCPTPTEVVENGQTYTATTVSILGF